MARAAKRRTPILVDADERRHLVEDCAFFRADHFRDAEPGTIRESDRLAAAAEIESAIGQRKGKARRR